MCEKREREREKVERIFNGQKYTVVIGIDKKKKRRGDGGEE